MNSVGLKWLLVVGCLVLAFPAFSQTREKLTFLVSEFPPYEFTSGGQVVGIDPEIVRSVFERLGYEVDIHVYPWARAQEMGKSGEVTGLFSFLKTPEREQFFNFSQPLGTIKNVFFKLKNHPLVWKSLADLKQERLVVNRGYAYDAAFQKALDTGLFQSVFVLSAEQPELKMLRMLVAGRADIVIGDINLMNYLIKTNQPEFESINYNDKPVGEVVSYYLGISKKWPKADKILADFNREFKKFAADGRLNQVYEKYGWTNP